MGVIIGYKGKIKDKALVDPFIKNVEEYARKHKWECQLFFEKEMTLKRDGPADENGEWESWNYTGPVTILRLMCHPQCDPLCFEIGEDLIFSDFVKTQFAPVDIHIAIIELLQRVQPFLSELEVEDEGEYWETRDRSVLEQYIHGSFQMINHYLAENPHMQVPERIVDMNGSSQTSLSNNEAAIKDPTRASRFQNAIYYAAIASGLVGIKILIHFLNK